MSFPILREKDFKFKRNHFVSRNERKQEKIKTKDRYLNEDFNDCPDCDTQNLIEVAKPEENSLIDFCLNCGYKKDKGELK